MDFIEINAASRIPKYRQVCNSIEAGIREQQLLLGDRILSINRFSETYDISRDTVEKAYNYLRAKNIIASVKGKGYYVARTNLAVRLYVLFVANKLSKYEMGVYNAFVQALGRQNAKVDIEIFHSESQVFKDILNKNKGLYDYYVIMPHFKDGELGSRGCTKEILEAMQEIPTHQLILLDQEVQNFSDSVGKIFQDYEQDIYDALTEGLEKLKKYHKMILVYPSTSPYPYPREIVLGFKMFCDHHGFEYEILDQIHDGMSLELKSLYFIIEEEDLVNLVKQARNQCYERGKDIGIISYNDSPLEELLGITVMTRDGRKMGATAAEMILAKRHYFVRNEFHTIIRQSS